MWSTVTLTPTLLPQSLTNGSNHASWAGTKWLHNRIDSDPLNFEAGSRKAVSVGAPSDDAASAGDGPAVFLSLPHAASRAAAAADWMKTRRVIPGHGRNVPMRWNLPRGGWWRPHAYPRCSQVPGGPHRSFVRDVGRGPSHRRETDLARGLPAGRRRIATVRARELRWRHVPAPAVDFARTRAGTGELASPLAAT